MRERGTERRWCTSIQIAHLKRVSAHEKEGEIRVCYTAKQREAERTRTREKEREREKEISALKEEETSRERERKRERVTENK